MNDILRTRPLTAAIVSCGCLVMMRAAPLFAQSPTVIPRTNWSLRFVDSEETAAANNAGTNAFDGDPTTFWHTRWSTGSDPMPHEIQINLGATYNVTGFRH